MRMFQYIAIGMYGMSALFFVIFGASGACVRLPLPSALCPLPSAPYPHH
jgi:hypothetical protein